MVSGIVGDGLVLPIDGRDGKRQGVPELRRIEEP